MHRAIIILAAGKGTRMKTDIPKVLVPVNGEPMIFHVLRRVQQVPSVTQTIMVIGYGAEEVRRVVGDQVTYVVQEQQRGTGHAVACCREVLKDFSGTIAVVFGDHPLLSPAILQHLFEQQEAGSAVLTMATTIVPDFNDWREGFYGFGRILRDDQGHLLGIREMKDCSATEKEIHELNPSYYCFNAAWLWQHIDQLQDTNAQGELYLTDLVAVAHAEQSLVATIAIDPVACLGVNTPEQLTIVESKL